MKSAVKFFGYFAFLNPIRFALMRVANIATL